MKNIVIKKMNSNRCDYIIFSTTVESPFFFIEEIKKIINPSKKITIIFDQLFQTGDSNNRFLSFNIDKDIKYDSAKIINDDLDELKKIISEYLFENQEVMEYSILLDKQKEIIKEGGVI